MAGKTLHELLKERFGVSTSPHINPEVDQVGVAAVQICPNNPNRLSLNVINLSANIVYILPDGEVSAARGIRLDANGGAQTLIWDEDFELVSWAWYAIATGAASEILVLEMVTI